MQFRAALPGAPWRDLPETYGPRTTRYNRFVRWRRAGVRNRIMDALAAGHDAADAQAKRPRPVPRGCLVQTRPRLRRDDLAAIGAAAWPVERWGRSVCAISE